LNGLVEHHYISSSIVEIEINSQDLILLCRFESIPIPIL